MAAKHIDLGGGHVVPAADVLSVSRHPVNGAVVRVRAEQEAGYPEIYTMERSADSIRAELPKGKG